VIQDTISKNTIQVVEYDYESKGKHFYFEGRTAPYVDPMTGEALVVWIAREITERIEAEQQRLELAVEKEKVTFLREFLDNTTHDLKTPLTIVGTSLYLLSKKVTNASQQRHIHTLNEQVMILNQMIDDLLAVARLDGVPEFNLNPTDISALLEDIVKQLRPNIEYKQQKLHLNIVHEPLIVDANADELRRALLNLLDNAVKYTPENGSVTINGRREKAQVVIEIQDTGIGIPESDRKYIFNRFYRSEAARFAAAGTGLGLSIAQRTIELHNGHIEVESEAQHGTTFRVYLPLALASNK
jgi:two-component system OmpR family sensor kinase